MLKPLKNSRSLLWILGGAAVGAAAGFMTSRNDRDGMIDNLSEFDKHTRDGLTKRFRGLTGQEKAKTDSEMSFAYNNRSPKFGYDIDGFDNTNS